MIEPDGWIFNSYKLISKEKGHLNKHISAKEKSGIIKSLYKKELMKSIIM